MATEYAGEYGGGYTLTCILREGNLTIATGVMFAGGTVNQPYATFASEISVGDYVGLDIDTGNTYSAAKGLPVVAVAAAAEPIIGRVVTEPRWARMPSSSQTTWATMLSGQYYRKAVIEFFGVTSAHKAQVKGDGTAMEVGAPAKWDLSEDAWVDAGTSATGAFSFHYTNADDTNCLIGFGMYAFGSGAADTVGYDTIA